MNYLSLSQKRHGATLAGIFSLALCCVLLLCGAGTVPVENFAPQGAMQSDLNAGGHNLTNVATINATNVLVSGSLTLPLSFSLAYSHVSGTPTTLGGYGITDPVVLTNGSYADPAWLTSLAYSKLSGAPAVVQAGNNGSDFSSALTTAQNLGVSFSKVVAKSGNFTVASTDRGTLFNVTTGTNTLTATLPTAANGMFFAVRKADSGSGTITVNGASIGTAGHMEEVVSDGTGFYNKFIGGALNSSGNYSLTLPPMNNISLVASNLNLTGTLNRAVPANSVVIIIGESRTFYPMIGQGSNGQQVASGGGGLYGSNKPWPQQLSALPAFAGIPVYNYGVGSSTCLGGGRVLAGTASGSGLQNDYFYNATEYLNGALVGSVAGITSLPSALVPSPANGGVAYFIETHDGGNEQNNSISTSTYQTDMLANFATMRGYGSNVKVIAFCGAQGGYSTVTNLSKTGPYGDVMRSLLGTSTGPDAIVDMSRVFTDPTDTNWYQTDQVHFTTQAYYQTALMVQGAILGTFYSPTLARDAAVIAQPVTINLTSSSGTGLFITDTGAGSGTPQAEFYRGLTASSSTTGLNFLSTGVSLTTGKATTVGFQYINSGTATLNYSIFGPQNEPDLRNYGNGHVTLGNTADDGVNYLNVPGSALATAFNSNATQTTVSGSTSGNAVFSEPLAGSSFKVVSVHLAALNGTASYTLPTAFTNAGHEADGAGVFTTIGTGTVTVTGSTTTGDYLLIGY